MGRVKREGRGKNVKKGVEKQRGRNRNRQTCRFIGKEKKKHADTNAGNETERKQKQ